MNQPAFPTWKRTDDMAEGMTLRDYFAAAALQGMYANPALSRMYADPALSQNFLVTNANIAYAIADAMLTLRGKG